jgi:hypothetical protein
MLLCSIGSRFTPAGQALEDVVDGFDIDGTPTRVCAVLFDLGVARHDELLDAVVTPRIEAEKQQAGVAILRLQCHASHGVAPG